MTDRPTDPAAAPPRSPGRSRRASGAGASTPAIAVAIVALVLIFQNSQKVEVDFIFATTETPLFFVLIITFALGALTGWLLPHVRRGRSRSRESDKRD